MTNWDEIECLHSVIEEMASPLTRYLCGHLPHPNEKIANDIWRDALALDWEGDLNLLPTIVLDFRFYCHIITRRMYSRLIEFFGYNDSNLCHKLYYYENVYWFPYDLRSIMCHRCNNDVVMTDIFHVPMAQMWLDELEPFLNYPVALAYAAILGNHINLLKHLVANYGVDISRLNFLINTGATGFTMDKIACLGYLDMLKYLHEQGNQGCSTRAMNFAACNGRLDIVKWLHENRTEGCTNTAVNSAIKNGHTHIVDYLQQYPSIIRDDML